MIFANLYNVQETYKNQQKVGSKQNLELLDGEYGYIHNHSKNYRERICIFLIFFPRLIKNNSADSDICNFGVVNFDMLFKFEEFYFSSKNKRLLLNKYVGLNVKTESIIKKNKDRV